MSNQLTHPDRFAEAVSALERLPDIGGSPKVFWEACLSIFANVAEAAAVVAEIERRHRIGQPVLIGTRTVQASEMLAGELRSKGPPFNLLNATRHREEAQIVASAGQPGRITIATNMAGRGTDIKLGARVADAGGLHVLATERHESGRIDRQLYGRAGRQGDPGSAQAFISVEDEILARFAPLALLKKAQQAVRRGLPGAKTAIGTAVASAQRSAQRLAFRQRRQVLEMDTWLAEALSFAGGREG
jgi:preprotein translocase subunit SecA